MLQANWEAGHLQDWIGQNGLVRNDRLAEGLFFRVSPFDYMWAIT